MTRYQNHRNNECQKCKELIATTVNTINSTCLRDPNSCCFERDYGISFPTDPCEFAKTYKSILFRINSEDYRESIDSRNTWNKCVKENIESLELCKNKGKCAEIPPGPSEDHNLMVKWCNKKFPVNSEQVSCWECVAENSPCEWPELDTICSNLNDCRENNLLDVFSPPTGELLVCLEKFSTGDCCNAQTESTKGMSEREKQFFWEKRMAEG